MPRSDHVSQLMAHFEQAILTGEYAPGELLPSEREISAQMGVSRSVVREAINRLASLGLVQSQHGSGTRVLAPSGQPITVAYQRLLRFGEYRLADLVAVRLPLETTIAALAAERRTDEDLARLEATQKILGNPRRSLETHIQADLDFHATLANATGNPLFLTVLAPIQQLLLESRRQTLGRYGSEIAQEHHARILAAVQVSDPVTASTAMRQHLETSYQHLTSLDDPISV